VDKLKIDQSFIRGIDSDPRDRAIVRAIIGMAKALDLALVAEGVESPGHVSFLCEHDCEQSQGYYLGRPVSPHRLMREPMSVDKRHALHDHGSGS
jgi:EAL domain-containing protein (putative c-di-GMP-specific phosphodiesterase class I)